MPRFAGGGFCSMQRICRFLKSLFYVKVLYTGKKEVHTKKIITGN